MSKFNNRRTNGFDSIREMNRYQELKLLERAGKIQGLNRQARFDLIPNQYDDNGKLVYRGIYYIADFVYWQNHVFVVEDCKGFRTKEYQIKKKLMYYFHRIKIKES